MQLKINDKILSIPPYISTTWSNISALRTKGSLLVVMLKDGETINISGLTDEQVEQVFSCHAAYLEKETIPTAQQGPSQLPGPIFSRGEIIPFGETTTLSFAFGTLDGMNNAMQHNPQQANMPDLPQEILAKIGEIVKAIGAFDDLRMPVAQSGCNCMHCQLAKTLNPGQEISDNSQKEEPVSDEELRFEEWTITKSETSSIRWQTVWIKWSSIMFFLGIQWDAPVGSKGASIFWQF